MALKHSLKTGDIGRKTIVRETGEIKRERMQLKEYIRDNILYSKPIHFLDRSGIFRKLLAAESIHSGHEMNKPQSAKKIPDFIRYFEISMPDFEHQNYTTFNDFFTRKLKSGARPITASDNPHVAVSSDDCRLMIFENITQAHHLWIKGEGFTLNKLVQDDELAARFANGAVASFRLSLQDYHHYHSPVDASVEFWKEIKGTYFGVQPLVVQSNLDTLGMNARTVVLLKSPLWGYVLFVAIGAELVGSVKLTEKVKNYGKLRKGEEIGLFSYGGSSIIVVFEPNKMRWDEDIKRASQQLLLETDIKMGNPLDRLCK